MVVRKIHVQSEKQARQLGFISSPTIRINGRDIQLDVKESLCESCGDLCGEDVNCRVWVYQGKEYTAPPKAMIIDAVLREVYGTPGSLRRSKGSLPEFAPDRGCTGQLEAIFCCQAQKMMCPFAIVMELPGAKSRPLGKRGLKLSLRWLR